MLLTHLTSLCILFLNQDLIDPALEHQPFQVMAKEKVAHGQDRQSLELLDNLVLSKRCQKTQAAIEGSCTIPQALWFSGPLSLTSCSSVGLMALRVSLVCRIVGPQVSLCLVISILQLAGIPSVKKLLSQSFDSGRVGLLGFPAYLERGAPLEI